MARKHYIQQPDQITMPCEDISEMHKLIINSLDQVIQFDAVKNTCGRKVGSEKNFLVYKNKDIMEILDEPFLVNGNFLQRKMQISLQSTLREYLGLPPMYNYVKAEIVGIEEDDEITYVLTNIQLEVPVEKITPCANGCGTRCGPPKKT